MTNVIFVNLYGTILLDIFYAEIEEKTDVDILKIENIGEIKWDIIINVKMYKPYL